MSDFLNASQPDCIQSNTVTPNGLYRPLAGFLFSKKIPNSWIESALGSMGFLDFTYRTSDLHSQMPYSSVLRFMAFCDSIRSYHFRKTRIYNCLLPDKPVFGSFNTHSTLLFNDTSDFTAFAGTVAKVCLKKNYTDKSSIYNEYARGTVPAIYDFIRHYHSYHNEYYLIVKNYGDPAFFRRSKILMDKLINPFSFTRYPWLDKIIDCSFEYLNTQYYSLRNPNLCYVNRTQPCMDLPWCYSVQPASSTNEIKPLRFGTFTFESKLQSYCASLCRLVWYYIKCYIASRSV